MLGKVLISVAGLLFVIKQFFPARWRELKRRLDIAVNVMIVLLLVLYVVQLWQLSE